MPHWKWKIHWNRVQRQSWLAIQSCEFKHILLVVQLILPLINYANFTGAEIHESAITFYEIKKKIFWRSPIMQFVHSKNSNFYFAEIRFRWVTENVTSENDSDRRLWVKFRFVSENILCEKFNSRHQFINRIRSRRLHSFYRPHESIWIIEHNIISFFAMF